MLGATCWALSIGFFVVQAVAQAATTRPYSLVTNYISDLGSTSCGTLALPGHHLDVCSPLHQLVGGTFIVVGILHALGAIATYRAWPRPPVATIGLGLLVLAGAGLTLTGFEPENVNLALHTVGALVGILSLNLAMVLLGVTLLGSTWVLGGLALIAGIGGLVGTYLFTNPAAGVPAGIAERIADYPGAAMVVVFGCYLLWSAIVERPSARLESRKT